MEECDIDKFMSKIHLPTNMTTPEVSQTEAYGARSHQIHFEIINIVQTTIKTREPFKIKEKYFKEKGNVK